MLFVRATNNLLMGTLHNIKHISCFKQPTLSRNYLTNVALQSKIVGEIMLRITFLGIFVTLFQDINKEKIFGSLNDLGSDSKSFSFNKILVCREHSFSANIVKLLPVR